MVESGISIGRERRLTKSVAIYGFAPQTRGLIKHSKANEVWTMNAFYNYGLSEERVTRTFEMHELWMAYHNTHRTPEQNHYWEWMKKEHPFTMYMPKVRVDFINDLNRIERIFRERGEELQQKAADGDMEAQIELSKLGEELKHVEIGLDFFGPGFEGKIARYPMKAVIDNVIPELDYIDEGEVWPRRGIKPFFISSIDYMIALAIYEQYERIELYGVELREQTEWERQRAGATYWVGVAQGRGIDVLIPKKSVLMSAPLYGLEGGDQLIPVQVPEHLKKLCTAEFDNKRSMHNHLTGMFTTLANELKTAIEEDRTNDVERLRKDQDDLRTQIETTWREMYMNEGAINVLNYLIDHENMKVQPLEMRSITQLQNVVMNQNKEMDIEDAGELERSDGICSYCGRENGPIDEQGNCKLCSNPILPKETFEDGTG